MNSSKRRHVLAALSNLSKFMGRYDEFRMMIQKFGVKWSSREEKEARIIGRIVKANHEDVFEWIRMVKKVRPELSAFMDLMVYTGLRFEEAVHSYNLIISLSKEGRLSEYYDSERMVLEHYKFRDLFIRKGKKALISFAPKELIHEISCKKPLTRTTIERRLIRASLPLRFSDIREFWASIMTKYLSQPEIDFLQGRVGLSIFMQNYFNPVWIMDLKDRALKGVKEITKQISPSS